jgi:small subunit ribosomal protein S20
VANSPQAKKRARQAEKRRNNNASLRSLVRTNIKKVDAAISSGNAEQAKSAYASAVPVIDRMADKGTTPARYRSSTAWPTRASSTRTRPPATRAASTPRSRPCQRKFCRIPGKPAIAPAFLCLK